MSTFLVTSDSTGVSGVIAPTDTSGSELILGPARRTPWLVALPSGILLCLYHDDMQQMIACRTASPNADGTWTLGAVVNIVASNNRGFAAFANPQKVVLAFLDSSAAPLPSGVTGGMRFALSQNEGDAWTLDVAAG